MNNVSKLSGAEKDRILAALLHDHPQLMETVVQQVTGNNIPRQHHQQQQQQHQRVDHGRASSSSSSSTDSETSRTMNSPPAASRKRRRPRTEAASLPVAARSNKKRARKKTTTTPMKQARITPSQDANWQLRYQELLEYKQIHHTTLVPVHSSALGKWVHNQRQAFRAYQSGQVTATGGATITESRILALNDAGFVWSTLKEPLVSFERRLEQMRMYKMEHGHLKVPTSHASGLAAWMQSQRNRQHSMTRERWHLLDAAGMEWVKTPAAIAKKKHSSTNNNNNNASRSTIRKITQAEFRNDTRASIAAADAAADVATTATAPMTNNYPPLAQQQQQQPCQRATAMAHHAGATTMQEDAAAMKDDAPKKQRWQSRYDELIEYKRVHGTTLVPVNSSALGKWVHNQRQAFRAYHSDKPAKGPTLTAERLQALNDIGFVWYTFKEPLVSFETRLEQMRKYKQEHGNLRVSKRNDTNGLSWWLQSQRNRQHSMSRERFAQLDAAGMEWETMMKERSNNSISLIDNKKKKNTASSSKPRATTRQDSAIKAVPHKERWQLRYDELVEYKRVHGTTLVPVNSSALGKWVGNMRQAYRDYHSDKPAHGPTLNEQRIQKLNDIGFVWNALKKEPLVSVQTRRVPTDHASGGGHDGGCKHSASASKP